MPNRQKLLQIRLRNNPKTCSKISKNNIDGVIKNKDVECVHKTRVTSRKIQSRPAPIQILLSQKKFKKWSKQIKKVTRLLANARDLDVQIAFIEKYVKNLIHNRKDRY